MEVLVLQVFVSLMLVGGSLLLVAIAPFANQLPLPVQRCMTVLPFIDLDPAVRADTRASTDWRLRMWEVVLPDIPKYLWVGKGCTANATDTPTSTGSGRYLAASSTVATSVLSGSSTGNTSPKAMSRTVGDKVMWPS